jgi:hypothetical protein
MISALRWDGVFPWFVAVVSLIVSAAFPRNDLAEIAVIILLPIFAALVRAAKARGQLIAISDCRPTLARQAGFGIAIAALLVFEFLFGILLRAQPPWQAWWPVLILYAVYLTLILVSLRPNRSRTINMPYGSNDP